MRVRVDRQSDVVRLELGEIAGARISEVAAGVRIFIDEAGRTVGVEVEGVDGAALHEFIVELDALEDRPTMTAPRRAPTASIAPKPLRHMGPLSWDADAEDAVAQLPFFRRGPARLAATELARKRGQDRVSLDIVRAIGTMR